MGLGTTLVATIEEAKDRISQIEHIFFPTFHLKSENLQTFFPEGKKAREDVCKEKENDLILPIERLQCEKQQALEENQSLKLELGYLPKLNVNYLRLMSEWNCRIGLCNWFLKATLLL